MTHIHIAIICVAVLHLLFLLLEMLFWKHPSGRRITGLTLEQARQTATLAANQGLYNGFLAAGLVWGLIIGDFATKAFFLICVLIAGLYGGLTTKRTILYLQALPGLLALVFLYLTK